jgi:hypothetical protein
VRRLRVRSPRGDKRDVRDWSRNSRSWWSARYTFGPEAVTLGIFLLLAARNRLPTVLHRGHHGINGSRKEQSHQHQHNFKRPFSTHGAPLRNYVIVAHAAVMAVMAIHLGRERLDLLIAGAVFSVIGAALIVLAPAKPSGERASAAAA